MYILLLEEIDTIFQYFYHGIRAIALTFLCFAVLSLLVISVASTSPVNKPLQCLFRLPRHRQRSQGWISAIRSSIFAAKTTAFVGSIVFDLWLRHKSYRRVGRQTIYLVTPDRSPSNVPQALTHWQCFRWVLPRAALHLTHLRAPHVPTRAYWHHYDVILPHQS